MNIKTVADLITQLQEYAPQAPIRFATEPDWPHEYTIAATAQSPEGTVYLVEGVQTGNLCSGARETIGW